MVAKIQMCGHDADCVCDLLKGIDKLLDRDDSARVGHDLKRLAQRSVGYCEQKYCNICFMKDSPSEPLAITKCNHTYHKRCLRTWFKYSNESMFSFRCSVCTRWTYVQDSYTLANRMRHLHIR